MREQDSSASPHYHVVLLFNKDIYAYLGPTVTLRTTIWLLGYSVLGVVPLAYLSGLCVFSIFEEPAYVFDRRAATVHTLCFASFYCELLI